METVPLDDANPTAPVSDGLCQRSSSTDLIERSWTGPFGLKVALSNAVSASKGPVLRGRVGNVFFGTCGFDRLPPKGPFSRCVFERLFLKRSPPETVASRNVARDAPFTGPSLGRPKAAPFNGPLDIAETDPKCVEGASFRRCSHSIVGKGQGPNLHEAHLHRLNKMPKAVGPRAVPVEPRFALPATAIRLEESWEKARCLNRLPVNQTSEKGQPAELEKPDGQGPKRGLRNREQRPVPWPSTVVRSERGTGVQDTSPEDSPSGRPLWTAPLDGASTWPLWTGPLDGPSGWALWTAPLDGASRRPLYMASLDGLSGRALWTGPLDGASGRRLWTASLDGHSTWSLWTVSLDGPSGQPL
ncbi:hypothetical protein M885DRAFT_78858 [Pelagophyceae sp. CCMP2097]|nr:hypothetical protein M885DRAFT_78858 [Pelagophyceae sp. CCMP2097]